LYTRSNKASDTAALINKKLKVKNIENIESWTDAFCNFAKIALQRHPMLATDLISCMILITGAVSDALFER
jgi:hypothetical protein